MNIAIQTSNAARQGEVTNAWVLRKGADHAPRQRGQLELTKISLPPLPDDRVLVETLYGSWEGNMTHALNRDPIDVCRRLGQDFIVLGNSAVVRVLATGGSVQPIREGTLCMFAPVAKQDAHGYVQTVCAYDEPNSMGCLAERSCQADPAHSAPRRRRHRPFTMGEFPGPLRLRPIELACGARCVAAADGRRAV